MSLPLRAAPKGLKRRLYLLIAAISTVTSFIGVWVYLFVLDPRNHYINVSFYTFSTLFYFGLSVAILSQSLTTRRAGPLLFVASSVTFFFILVLTLYSGYPEKAAQISLIGVYIWFPVLYILGFLLVSAKRAFQLSLVLLGLIASISLPHALTSSGGEGVLDGFSTLGHVYLSHTVMIAALYFFATFQGRLEKVEEEASAFQQLAYTDELTGAPNRRQIEHRISNEMTRSLRYHRFFSVLMIDIDNFKQINDTYGHDVGDTVLKGMVLRLRSSVRSSDQVARWGGEEFLILAPETDLSEAATLAEHLRHGVASHPFVMQHPVTISLGVATFRGDDTLLSLIKRADDALYEAKSQGKNKVITETAQV